MSVYEAVALVIDAAALAVAVLVYIRDGKHSDKRK
jgi:hypothetical protein